MTAQAAYFEVDLAFVSNGATEEFDEFLDRVLDELEKLGREVDYTASASALTATFSISADDFSDDELIAALTALRTGLHAAGCGTAIWPQAEFVAARSIKERDLVAV